MKAVNFHNGQPGAPRSIGIPEILAAMRGMVNMFERGRDAAAERAEHAERMIAERMNAIEGRIVAVVSTVDRVAAELRAESNEAVNVAAERAERAVDIDRAVQNAINRAEVAEKRADEMQAALADAANRAVTVEAELRGLITLAIAGAAEDHATARKAFAEERVELREALAENRAEVAAMQAALSDAANRVAAAEGLAVDAINRAETLQAEINVLQAERGDFAIRIDASVNAIADLADAAEKHSAETQVALAKMQADQNYQIVEVRAAIADATNRADTAERAAAELVRAAVSAVEERMIVDAALDASGNLIVSNSRGEMRTICKTATENKDFELRNRAIKLKNEGKSLAAICKELGLTRYALGKLMK